MKKAQRNSFKFNPIAAAIAIAMTSQFAANVAQAGSGFGAGVNTSNTPVAVPTYYANSPVGPVPALVGGAQTIDPVTGLPLVAPTGKALRKFVDKLPGIPGLSPATVGGAPFGINNLGQYIPLAKPEKWVDLNGTLTGDDYYEIAAVEFSEKMHSDLPKATRLRGYVQLSTAKNPGKHIALRYPVPAGSPAGTVGAPILDAAGLQVYAYDNPHHLGPVISSTTGTAVRIKFTNYLPTGTGGDLFIPVDKTITGAGMGPDGVTPYTQNRAVIHLVGGQAPWISAGTPHQWVAPAGETNPATDPITGAPIVGGKVNARGASAQNVPDMADPGPGSNTLYFPNNMSARFMFYQDRTSGLTRLNSYAGLDAGYLVTDPTEKALIAAGTIPADQIPLIIEDKTFVPRNIAQQDAKWDTTHWGQPGDLWFPHVYEPNQDPTSASGTNPVGRWDYGPLFWPIFPAKNPLPTGGYTDPSFTPEAYMDTPLINGTAYPTLTVDPKAYRFRMLNASNDRYINLSLYMADPSVKAPQLDLNGNPIVDAAGVQQFFTNTEVRMVPAVGDAAGNPPGWNVAAGVQYPLPQYPTLPTNINAEPSGPARAWPVDARVGGAPDPTMAGPDFIAIGNDGGFLPNPVDIPAQPVTYEANRRSITISNIYGYGMLLGPAERADAIVDFSKYAGQTLILYNDAPAPTPFADDRNDYYTGGPDLTGSGGNYSTKPGYGPNTRTMMQIKVNATTPAAAFDPTPLLTALPAAYGASQAMPIVPAVAYNAAFKTNNADVFAHVATGSAAQPTLDFTTSAGGGITLTGLTLINSGGTVGAGGVVGANPVPGSGSGYDPKSPPAIVFNNVVNGVNCLSGAGAASASAIAVVDANTHQVTGITGWNPGSGYTCAPIVTFTPSSAISTKVAVTSGGAGYTAPTASIAAAQGDVTGSGASLGAVSMSQTITVTPPSGSGYTKPTVTVTGGGLPAGTVITGTATVGTSAATTQVLAGGSGYSASPTVTVTGGGIAATGSATVGTGAVAIIVTGGAGYSATPTVTVTGGGIAATASATVDATGVITSINLTPSTGFTSAPTIAITDTTGSGASATATVSAPAGTITGVTLTPSSGFTSLPSIVITDTTGTGANVTASLVDPTAGTVTGVTLSQMNGFLSLPTITITDPTGISAPAKVNFVPGTGVVTGIAVNAQGSGYTATPVITITDTVPAGTTPGSGANAMAILSTPMGIGAQAVVGSTNASSIPVLTKAEQELFDASGRYNSTGGIELPLTSAVIQTTVPLNYMDTPTEIIGDSDVQIWKLVDNGFWSNSMHFDFVEVQLVNRVGWDGTVKPPATNETGWKDTLRLNPLEDVVVAMRAKRPSIPFGLPQSKRLLDPSKPLNTTGAAASGLGFTVAAGVTPPLDASNVSANFDNEFAWNSAILGHSENDLTRPVVYRPTVLVPTAPSNLNDPLGNGILTWTDPTPVAAVATKANPQNEIGFKIKQATLAADGVTWSYAPFLVNGVEVTVPANKTSWTQPAGTIGTTAFAVTAYNAAGESAPSTPFADAVPVAPTTFTGVATAYNSVTLNWAGNTTNNSIQVWRDGVLIATLPGAATSYVDTTVTAVMTYNYTITVLNSLGKASTGPLQVTTPMIPVAAPTALTAVPNTAGTSVAVRWTDNANNETSYWLDVTVNNVTTRTTITRTAAQRTATAGVVTTNITTVPGSAYTFTVTAVNVTGTATSTSSAVTTTVDLSAPVAPAAPVVVAGVQSATRAPLSWAAVAGATSYVVQVSTNGGTFNSLPQTTALNANPAIAAGNSYSFRVLSQTTRFGFTTQSLTASNVVNVITPPAASTTPVGVPGAVGSKQITVSWTNNSSNITGFTVQRRVGGIATTIAATPTAVTAAGVTTYSFTDTVPAAGSYSYRVTATSAGGTNGPTAYSTAVTAP